jgi:hypothetical protein
MGWRELWGCQGVGGFWNPSGDFGWNPSGDFGWNPSGDFGWNPSAANEFQK